jgi:hypothetical protein
MKKILLLIVFQGLGFGMFAQSLTLSYLQGILPNNTDVYVLTPLNEEIEAHVFVTNTSGVAKSVECKKTEIEKVTGSTNYFCWGACYPPNTMVGVLPVTIAAGAINKTNFTGYYNCHGFGGTTSVRYTFFVVGNANDSVCFNVHFTGCSVGIDDTESGGQLSAVFPNPARDRVTFRYGADVISGGEAHLEIYNLLGEHCGLYSVSAGDPETTISTTTFKPGLYYATLVNNGQRRASYKFSISR